MIISENSAIACGHSSSLWRWTSTDTDAQMIPDKFTAANRALALLGALLVAGATAGVIGILLYPALLLTCVIVGASGPVKYWATIGGWLNDKLASNKIPTFLR